MAEVTKAGLEVVRKWGGTPQPIEDAMAASGMGWTRAFSPGRPIEPYHGYSTKPRVWDLPTGYNTISRPDRNQRVSFAALKSLIDNYDMARIVIGHRIDDIRSLDWTLEAAPGVVGDVSGALAIAREKMARPDPEDDLPFRAWLAKYLEDVLRYDAGCLYRVRNMVGDVIGLRVVSGLTIAPVLNYWGGRPQAPEPAFSQFVNGVPWEWFTRDDLIYVPFRPQPDSPYGWAPLESVLLTANTDIRLQVFFLQNFTDGNIPEGFATAPEGYGPDQLQELQSYWDALMYGDQAVQQQLKWVPYNTSFSWSKDRAFDPAFAKWLTTKVAAAYHVTLNDLGIIDDVNRAQGEVQVSVQQRIGTLPLAQHVQDLLTHYLQHDLKLPVEFKFITDLGKADIQAQAQADKTYIESGVLSPDEVREKTLGLEVDAARPVPRFIMTKSGPVLLSSLYATSPQVDSETATVDTSTNLPAQTAATVPELTTSEPLAIAASLSAPVVKDAEPAVPEAPSVAGLAVKAADTGRVLMLQRCLDPTDPAGGTWEFPGGHVEDGEGLLEGACREWAEEVGCHVPAGQVSGGWQTPNGIYQGFVWVIPSEAGLQINLDGDDRAFVNPDDPDGDMAETIAWWDPQHLSGNPGVRPELTEILDTVLAAVDAATLPDPAGIQKELTRWRTNARNRIKQGKSPKADFVSTTLPERWRGQVRDRLAAARTLLEVDEVFRPVVKAGPKAPGVTGQPTSRSTGTN